VVLVFRVLVPVTRSIYHGLRVVDVRDEAPGVVSIVCTGRHLERLAVSGGQFFQWRFLQRGMWWQAHPYSLSALPRPPYLRFTVKATGDHSLMLHKVPKGTRLFIEGPYGAFTPEARRSDRLLLVAAGVGMTPLRALLEDLPRGVTADVIVRVSSPADLLFRSELDALVSLRGGTVHQLVGSRHEVAADARALGSLVPDIASRDVYVCGPEGFNQEILGAVRLLGLSEQQVHHESFAF